MSITNIICNGEITLVQGVNGLFLCEESWVTNTCCDMAMTDWELVLQKRTKIYFVQKQSESLFAGDSLDTMNYYY